MPEWGWRGPLKGAPSWSKRSRNTNGFRISPRSDGLIKRVTGPCVRPRVRCTIGRARRGGDDLAWVRVVIAVPPSGRAAARRLQGCGPPQQIVDHRLGRRRQLGQAGVDVAALEVSPQGGDRDVDRWANRG